MTLPRISTFPLHKPFDRLDPATPLSEVALRLVENLFSNEPVVLGTATVLSGNLSVTAKHVLGRIWSVDPSTSEVAIDKHIAAVQILPGPEYIVWDVVGATADPVADIALLHLGANPGRSDPKRHQEWRCLRVNPFAPDVGERVTAFGYRKSVVIASRSSEGGIHIDLNDEPMASVGIVREVFEWQRDSFRLRWPSYQVSARFDGGMSGGPVFDEFGCLCGIVCSNLAGSHIGDEPLSYVTMLWPLFRLILSQDRGDNYPRGIRYPAIELARGGQIAVPDLPRLEQWFTKHIELTQPA